MDKQPAVLVFSGGPDSTAAAIWAVSNGFDVSLLTFQFRGADQQGEIFAAQTVARALGLPICIIDFKGPMLAFRSGIHPMMHAGIRDESREGETGHRMA